MRNFKWFVVIVAVVALGGSVTACGTSGSGDVGTSRVEVVGQALPRFVAGGKDPAQKMVAPTLDGKDFAGARVRIGGAAGDTRRVVVFLSHWCRRCESQARNLAEWVRTGDVPSNVEVTVVATSTDRSKSNYPPSKFLSAAGLGRVTTLVDDDANRAADAYGVTQLPTSVMLLPDNRVLGRLGQDLSPKYFTTLAKALSIMPGGGSPGTTPSTIPRTTTSQLEPSTSTTEPDTSTTEPPSTTPPSGRELTAAYLMSMIGRPPTDTEWAILSDACHVKYLYREDVHCEDVYGFGLSTDNGSVREVYLEDADYPGGSSSHQSFPGALPGGVSWDWTQSDILGSLGEPDCVEAIMGYNLHYTIGELDVAYTVESDMQPTANLYKITIHSLADRPASCHLRTR